MNECAWPSSLLSTKAPDTNVFLQSKVMIVSEAREVFGWNIGADRITDN